MYDMPFAQYDPDTQSWKTSEVTSLWALPMSSLTLPAWGGMQGGELFEHPTPERPTVAPGCSSLPTPKASNNENQQNLTRYGPNLGMVVMPDQYQWHPRDPSLLPTPTSQAAKHALDDRGPGTLDDANLWSIIGRIGVSTPPQSSDGNHSPDLHQRPLFNAMTATDSIPYSSNG
jgi:hypothetical protein